jgi:hypothetical protein
MNFPHRVFKWHGLNIFWKLENRKPIRFFLVNLLHKKVKLTHFYNFTHLASHNPIRFLHIDVSHGPFKWHVVEIYLQPAACNPSRTPPLRLFSQTCYPRASSHGISHSHVPSFHKLYPMCEPSSNGLLDLPPVDFLL